MSSFANSNVAFTTTLKYGKFYPVVHQLIVFLGQFLIHIQFNEALSENIIYSWKIIEEITLYTVRTLEFCGGQLYKQSLLVLPFSHWKSDLKELKAILSTLVFPFRSIVHMLLRIVVFHITANCSIMSTNQTLYVKLF